MSAAVVALPTAADRKVKQTVRGQAYRTALDDCVRFPLEPRFEASPYQQRIRDTARKMLAANDSAIMQLAMALFATSTDEQRARVQGRLLGLMARNRTGAAEALAWIDYEQSSLSRKQAIDVEAAIIAREQGL